MRATRVCLVLLASGCAEQTVTAPEPAAPAALGEQQETQNNSYSINAENGAMYVKIARVRTEDGERIHAFMRKMFATADSANAQRLVIDLRPVSGSDARLLVPLIKGIVTRERFAKNGGLFVVVGDESFSPKQSAARLMQQYANPIFVRKPPG